MHITTELNVNATVSVRQGENGKVELVFVGGEDDSSIVIETYPEQANALMDGLFALAGTLAKNDQG